MEQDDYIDIDIDVIKKACEILRKTNDGEDLAPAHLTLVELAVNGFTNDKGMEAFRQLHADVLAGYRKPWLHGVEGITINHQGYVFWKDTKVEHFNIPYAYTGEAADYCRELQRRCLSLEGEGVEVSVGSAVWHWPAG